MSNRTRTWFAPCVVLVAVLAADVVRAEDGMATYVVQEDVIADTAPAARVDEAKAPKIRPGDDAAAKGAPVVEEDARVIRARYSREGEGRGEPKR